MRAWIVAGLVVMASAAGAQDGARVATIAKVKSHRAEWAGEFVRIENVSISGFSQAQGGVASDATGDARLDDVGMPPRTISHLERYCRDSRAGQSHAGCRGALEFTVSAGEGARGRFTISDAEFIPED